LRQRIKYCTPLEIFPDLVYVWAMSHSHHHHAHEHRAIAAAPTFSLLRLSAWERLAGAGVVLCALWLLVFGVLG
jgi:hypothetical protein